MKYQMNYNPCRKIWTVWCITDNNAEIVKTFKTETAAKKWIEKQG